MFMKSPEQPSHLGVLATVERDPVQRHQVLWTDIAEAAVLQELGCVGLADRDEIITCPDSWRDASVETKLLWDHELSRAEDSSG